MATSGGPKTEREGLVFGFDTGYKVADINTGTRFFKGRPTTNLITDAAEMSGWSSYSNGNDGTFLTEFGTVGYRINNRASWNGLYKDFNVGSTGTYQFSAWFKYLGGTSSNNGATVYSSGHGGNDTANSLNKNIVGKWQRVTHQVSVTDVTLRYYLISYGGSQSTDKSSWEVTMPQIELMPAVTPFVNGTRSSTQSLIDLTKTVDIDMNTVSFDSTGQPDFDGTDDYLQVSLSGVSLDSGCTIEGVLKRNSTPGAWRTFFNIKAASANTPFFEFRSNANTQHIYADYYNGTDYSTTAATLNTGDWGHAVATYDGSGNVRMYLNGELIGTKTGVPSFALGTSPRLTVGRAYSNDRNTDIDAPVVKVYNTPLSALDVKRNFIALKNRFNL